MQKKKLSVKESEWKVLTKDEILNVQGGEVLEGVGKVKQFLFELFDVIQQTIC